MKRRKSNGKRRYLPIPKGRNRRIVPESTLKGRAGNQRGRINEERALRILQENMPPWAVFVRKATLGEDDPNGWDLVLLGNDGFEVGVQVKSSRGKLKEHCTKWRKRCLLGRLSYRYYATVFVVVNNDRGDCLVLRELAPQWEKAVSVARDYQRRRGLGRRKV